MNDRICCFDHSGSRGQRGERECDQIRSGVAGACPSICGSRPNTVYTENCRAPEALKKMLKSAILLLTTALLLKRGH
ncbi:hypothetical protein SRHO_G00330030 [Serrasalmus rhombeus]